MVSHDRDGARALRLPVAAALRAHPPAAPGVHSAVNGASRQNACLVLHQRAADSASVLGSRADAARARALADSATDGACAPAAPGGSGAVNRAFGQGTVDVVRQNGARHAAVERRVDDEVPELEDTNDEALVCAIDILNRDAKLLGKLKTFMKSNPLDLAATDPTHIAKQITSQCSVQFA